MNGTGLVAGALVVAPIAAWIVIYAAVLAATRPHVPPAAPATPDLGGEPPAVASLLVNHWEVTEDAAESTLLDLAARHILELRQPGNEPVQTTVHVKAPQPVGLTAYEQRVFDRVAMLASGGVVPLTALTFRNAGEASGWSRRLAGEVIAEARTRGLSRRRIGPPVVTALTLAAAAAAACVGIGVAYYLDHRNYHGTGDVTLAAAVVTFVVLSGIGGRPRGERDTAAGRAAASRWLGVRGWLRGHDAFGDLPPAAVAVWDRYLSYGAAVGATRLCSAVIDLGMANRHNVWSSWNGGVDKPGAWHRVRVHYPRFWPRYGKSAPRLLVKAVICGGIGYVLIRYSYRGIGNLVKLIGTKQLGTWAQYVALVKSAGVLVGIVALVYGTYVILRVGIDLSTQRTITGEVAWVEAWHTATNNRRPSSRLAYLAVDDGSADSTRAWALPVTLRLDAQAGDAVTITVRPWSRRVVHGTVIKRGGAARLSIRDIGTASQNSEALIASAMGIPAAASSAPAFEATPLLSAEEVGGALGIPVMIRRQSTPSPLIPVDVLLFDGPDRVTALTLTRLRGMAAAMALRARRHGEAISGVGDEAYGGAGWIVASRGGEAVALTLGGTAAHMAPPAALVSLAQTAVGRLAAPVA